MIAQQNFQTKFGPSPQGDAAAHRVAPARLRLEPTKAEVLKQYQALKKKGLSEMAVEKALAKIASKDRQQPLYNRSPFTFSKLIGDPNGLAKNLTAYIKGFSPKVREVFEKFEFEKEIEKLDETNRLFEVIKEFAGIDLHPERVPNLAMGYVFEHLIRRFNEQANEEAGDHFTPREVIRLMAHLIYTGDEDIYRPGISRTIYDPACGMGGMLSVSEAYIREQNDRAHLALWRRMEDSAEIHREGVRSIRPHRPVRARSAAHQRRRAALSSAHDLQAEALSR